MATCVTWKQPDADHFNGFCTNKFRLTTPPYEVRVHQGCDLCVNPNDQSPPIQCGDCTGLDDGQWPSGYTVRGPISAPADADDSYVAVSENAVGRITRTTYVRDFTWSEIAGIFDGGRIISHFTSKQVHSCNWRRCVSEITSYRNSQNIYLPASAGTCGVARENSASVDLITLLKRVESPMKCAYFGITPTPPNASSLTFNQCVPADAFGLYYGGRLNYWFPSFVAQWPSGYGDVSGLDLPDDNPSLTTGTPIFSGCPALEVPAYSYGAHARSKTLRASFGVGSGVAQFNFVPGALRIENLVYYNKVLGRTPGTIGETIGFPAPPDTGAPDPPYSVYYKGAVDCSKKDYFLLTKDTSSQPDPLNVYPSTIELIG